MKKHSLTHVFIKLFISLMVVALAIIALEMAVVSFSLFTLNRNWPNFISSEYVNNVLSDMENYTVRRQEDLVSLFLDNVDLKVSSLLLRDIRYERMYLYDEENSGLLLELDFDNLVTFRKTVAVYEVEVSSTPEDFQFVISPLSNSSVSNPTLTYFLPSFINEDEIAATIFVSWNGEMVYTIDILVDRMNNFGPTRFVTDTIVVTIVWIVPLTLVVSILMAYYISRRTSRSVDDVRKMLHHLENSEFDFDVGKQSTYELEMIGQSVEELRNTLKQNKLARDEWIRSIAHDLNTPITSISLIVEGLLDGVFKADEAMLKRLKSEVDVLSSRVSKVKYYATLLSPEATIHRDRIEAGELMDGFENQLGNKKTVVNAEEGAVFDVDVALFYRALAEVVNNVYESGEDKTACISVKSNLVVVRNKGKLPSPQPNFFEPWARGDLSRHEGGSGLGLPIVGQIIRLHGGTASIGQEGDEVVVTLDFGPIGEST